MHGLYGVADRIGLHALHVTAKSPNKPLEVDLKINGRDMSMELDTGAATSVVSEKTFQSLWPDVPLQQTSMR